MRRFDFHEPTTLEEAAALKRELGDDAYFFAGGTDLLVEIRERLRVVKHVIDIKKIPGLREFSYDDIDGLRFGALTMARELETSPIVREKYPNFATALRELGSIQVRNRATVLGNICRASPSADTIPPLIADEATIDIYSPEGSRTIALESFFTGPGRTVLRPGEIATGVAVPAPKPNSGRSYIKHGRRKAMELATVGAAVSLESNGRVCTGVRVALGAVGATVLRASKAEKILKGSGLETDEIKRAASQAMLECAPISNVRSSAEYRRDMVGVLTERAVKQALENIA